ncbi:ABC transporter ATP-binding protein [Paenactinomyces guangxiensis]|uniref:ABC transporter ATP-binding protein n=1 Tax=Paenactinomyces guangxiensis TaxID=1490290 RepID=A0A7W1WSX7_9BACL|nr:ABC transporter ATP-binding protein [Paenactinomyces guangxiensis]MBA4495403.1 ABC transporter ATP-binding protein [Paenactinomyces guangxiensis]MBH8592476.1 ABC transporter ATP-binding protein [Paenactinomyces guangxiensis]
MTNAYAVQTVNLTKRFKNKTVVRGINLEVPKGEIYGFLGPNGAGKTTTIKMLLGLTRPTEGEAYILGKNIQTSRNQVLGKVGSLVESPSYYGHLTGYENLKIITQVLGLNEKRIDEVLRLVRLEKDAHRLARNYSLGMKQRLGIAAALIGNPELLILDEPTNGLDPAGIQEIRELIKSLPQMTGVTILLSSHLLNEIEQVASIVGIIHGGTCIYQNRLHHLKNQAAKKRIEMEVISVKEAAHSLKQLGWNVYQDQNHLCLDNPAKEEIALLIQSLVQHNFSIYDLRHREQSLEDIFLHLTGKGQSL